MRAKHGLFFIFYFLSVISSMRLDVLVVEFNKYIITITNNKF